jgi:RNA ligase
MRLGDLLDVNELRELIKSRHIIRRDHPELPMAILNYSNSCLFDNFWPETVQHCRGLIINPRPDHEICADCDVLSRPFHKFFNLNHQNQPDYLESNLPKVEPTVTEKMDGWFGIQWKCGDKYGVASRGSFTSEGALFATHKLQKLVKYGAVEEFPKGYTPIYEIIFKAGKIVVDYSFEGLVLLGCVNNETGEELPYYKLREIWEKIAAYAKDNRPWIRLVHAHNLGMSPIQMIKSLEEEGQWEYDGEKKHFNDTYPSEKKSTKNMEGFVLSYPRPGTWPIKVKVKFEEYKRLHKLITGITPQQIWKTLHDPLAPWLENNIPDHFRSWAIKWRDELYQSFQKKLATVMKLVTSTGQDLDENGIGRDDRKMLMAGMMSKNPELAGIAMTLLTGNVYDAHQAIWRTIRPVGRESEVFHREGTGE